MRFTRGLLVGASLALLAATPALAQPFKWWQDPKVRADMGLSQDQISRIDEVFRASTQGIRERYAEVDRLERQLSALISADEATEAEVIRQVTAIEAVRSELAKGRTLMLFRIHRVLTSEQRVKLAQMHERSQRDRGRSGGPVRR